MSHPARYICVASGKRKELFVPSAATSFIIGTSITSAEYAQNTSTIYIDIQHDVPRGQTSSDVLVYGDTYSYINKEDILCKKDLAAAWA